MTQLTIFAHNINLSQWLKPLLFVLGCVITTPNRQDIFTYCLSATFVKNKQGKSEGFDSCDRSSNLTQIGFKSSIFSLCGLEIWRMTLKNNPAPLLCYFKLCASFHTHWWIQTGVTVWTHQIWWYFSRVTLKFDWWPWKTIGHLFYPISSFVYHFIPIGVFYFTFFVKWLGSFLLRFVYLPNLCHG